MRPPRSAVLEPPSAPPRPVRPASKGRSTNGGPPRARPGDGRPPAPTRRPKKASWFWRYRRVWFLLGLVLLTALAGAVWVLTQIPLPPEAPQSQTTIIYDASGAQLATLHGQENRFPVRLDEVPAVVQNAIVAAEDRKFFQHGGIDPVGIARATWADVRQKGATQGGSTITQQYVKNVYVGADPTLWRKLREAVISVKLERKLDKRQILERYVNTVYFGRGAYGIQAAARTWFGKDVGALDLKEAAYLAGLIRTPSGGDVVSDPATAKQLRTFVLAAMLRSRYITPAQAADVEAVPLESYVALRTELDSTVTLQGVGAEYFVEYVRTQLLKTYSEDQVLRQGLRVQTSLDPAVQRQAFDAVYGLLDRPTDPAAALVAIDPDGRVVAMVGGRNWEQSKVNLAVGEAGGGSGRQAGSTFKPFALAATVREGFSLESSFPGPAKLVLPKADQGADWEVSNYEDNSFGTINLIAATVDSVNTVYAQLADTLGPQKIIGTAKDLGISSPLAPVPSIALGTQNVSVLEMAGAYSTLARGGLRYDPRVITKVTLNDSVLQDDRPKGTRVMERAQADQVNYALEQVVDRGSGTAAQIDDTKVWGKTGTTEDFGDAWFAGFTRKLTAVVWMGYPEGQSKPLFNVHGVVKVNGGSLPARIFERFMSKAGAGADEGPTSPPRFDGKPLSPVVRYSVPSSTPPSTASSGESRTATTRQQSNEEDEPTVRQSPSTTVKASASNEGAAQSQSQSTTPKASIPRVNPRPTRPDISIPTQQE